jgi:hypothetical protein
MGTAMASGAVWASRVGVGRVGAAADRGAEAIGDLGRGVCAVRVDVRGWISQARSAALRCRRRPVLCQGRQRVAAHHSRHCAT